MGTPTYTALANITLGSSASSVTFSSIPATYRDLVLVGVPTTSDGGLILLRLNGDTTSSNFFRVDMRGSSSGAQSSSGNDHIIADTTTTAGSNLVLQVMDYSATDKHKTYLNRVSNTATLTRAWAGRWANTSAVTSVGFALSSGTFQTGSTFNLFAIAG